MSSCTSQAIAHQGLLRAGPFPGMGGAPKARHQTRAADGANRELTPVLSAMLTAGWLAL